LVTDDNDSASSCQQLLAYVFINQLCADGIPFQTEHSTCTKI